MTPSLMWTMWVAWATAAPTYGSRQVHLDLDAPTVTELRALTTAAMAERGVEQLQLGELHTSPEALTGPQLGAALATLIGGQPGIEYDLILPGPDTSLLPISVWWEPAGTVRVEQGSPVTTAAVTPASLEALKALGVGELVHEDRRWTPAARGLVHQAWTLLTAEERSLLADVSLHRRSAPTATELAAVGRGPSSELEAIYQEDQDGGRIVVFDSALRPSRLFTGEVDAPKVAAVLTLLHEVAHALAATPGRRARHRFQELTRALERDIATYNEAVDRYNRLAQAQDPAALPLATQLQSLEEDLDRRTGAQAAAAAEVERLIAQDTATAATFAAATGGLEVTWYATASADEAFAEAYSLSKADPRALRRINEAALAWFTAGAHLHGASR